MIKNYFITAFRRLLRHKIYFFINIFGLSIGIACCLLIVAFVKDQLSYDHFHKNGSRIYRIIQEQRGSEGQIKRVPISPPPLAINLREEFPEIIHAIRFAKGRTALNYANKRFNENFFYVDTDVFDVFDFHLINGDPKTALSEPFSLVITTKIAEKYFGQENPLGKILTFNNRYDYKVTGVLKEMPHNSHIRFNILASIQGQKVMRDWNQKLLLYTYLLLPEGYNPKNLEDKLPDFVKKRESYLDSNGWIPEFHLQPLTEIYLYSDLDLDIESYNNIRYVRIFLIIAVFILLIACINFANLSTARSAEWSKEIGIRKTVGASRWQLAVQFLVESVLMSFLASILAIMFIELLYFQFNFGSNLKFNFLWPLWELVFIPLIIGLVSGSYPALFLSSYEASIILKGKSLIGSNSVLFRKALVVFQFSVTIFLVICTSKIYDQMNYVQTKDLKFNKDQIIAMPFYGYILENQYDVVKGQLLHYPGILDVAVSSDVPFRLPPGFALPKRVVLREGKTISESATLPVYSIDQNFIETLSIDLVAGRVFSKNQVLSDVHASLIINESAVGFLGWSSPDEALGKQIVLEKKSQRKSKKTGRIIGIVQDFHMQTLYQKIEPTIFHISPSEFRYVLVKTTQRRTLETLDYLKQTWRQFYPNKPFEYFFLDELMKSQYEQDRKIGILIGGFTLLAICIACLGLWGLALYTAQRRTKEIGIRKVLGASIGNLVMLLSKEHLKLVILASSIAWPVSYYTIQWWLQSFTYRVDIGLGIFIAGSLLIAFIALMIVGYQALKIAVANPIDALRYE